jgi:tetraacyldisaccharide 4'-kinase
VSSLEQHWYAKSWLSHALWPLSWLYCAVVTLRRLAYQLGVLRVRRMPVPVIVVGNLSVGGTGKTPLVTALVDVLRSRGYLPGIVSRGYRGKARQWPQQVRADSDPVIVGDEAVLLARRTGCPMAVAPSRVAAARALLKYAHCDVIVADDGLQHYALGRDVEILVVDGIRRFGNGRCLPAGPLREPKYRAARVDLVVTNGLAAAHEYTMRYEGTELYNIGDPSLRQPLSAFAGKTAHAVAGIGHPSRFFSTLQKAGLKLKTHPFPDHHEYRASDVQFGDGYPVIMTEKDAVKCRRFETADHWYLPVDAELPERFFDTVIQILEMKKHGQQAA